MEKVKEKIKEMKQDHEEFINDPETKEIWDRMEANKLNQLKPDINNLLYRYLPENTNLKDMETLAIVIHDIIGDPKKYLS